MNHIVFKVSLWTEIGPSLLQNGRGKYALALGDVLINQCG